MDASQEGRTDVVELLLSNGADVNATTRVSHLHIHVHTPGPVLWLLRHVIVYTTYKRNK